MSSTGAALHESAQQEVLSRQALLRQIAAACGPQHHLFLAATSRRWRSMYRAYSAAQETSYQSCLATPQLMRYALQAGLADIHRHFAKIVQPPVWLFRQTAQCAIEHGASWGSMPVRGNCTLRDRLSPQLFAFAHRHGCPCDCDIVDCRIVLWNDGEYLPAEPDIVAAEAGYVPPADH